MSLFSGSKPYKIVAGDAAQGKLCTVNGGAGSPEQVFAAIAAELDKYVK